MTGSSNLHKDSKLNVEGLLGTGKEEEEEKDNEIIPKVESSTRVKKPEKAIPENLEVNPGKTSIQLNNQLLSINTTDLSEIDEKLCENMEKHLDGTYSCKICGKTTKDKTKMRFHVETHMEGLSFPCNTCGKEFRSRNALKTHIYRKLCKL